MWLDLNTGVKGGEGVAEGGYNLVMPGNRELISPPVADFVVPKVGLVTAEAASGEGWVGKGSAMKLGRDLEVG